MLVNASRLGGRGLQLLARSVRQQSVRGMSVDSICDEDTDLEETGHGQNRRPEKEAQQHHPNFLKCFHDLPQYLIRVRRP
jgi:hypothetical protein